MGYLTNGDLAGSVRAAADFIERTHGDRQMLLVANLREAAQRLVGEISEERIIAGSRAACETIKPGRCFFPDCFCEEKSRRAINAALKAAGEVS